MNIMDNEVVLQKCRRTTGIKKTSYFFFFFSLILLAIVAVDYVNLFELNNITNPISFLPKFYEFTTLKNDIEFIVAGVAAIFLLLTLLLALANLVAYANNYLIITNKRVFVKSKDAKRNRLNMIELSNISGVDSVGKNTIVISLEKPTASNYDSISVNKIYNGSSAREIIFHLIRIADPTKSRNSLFNYKAISIDDDKIMEIVEAAIEKEKEEMLARNEEAEARLEAKAKTAEIKTESIPVVEDKLEKTVEIRAEDIIKTDDKI